MSADPLEGSERARQEFEKWAIDAGWNVSKLNAIDDDVYESSITQALLDCWQARGEQERLPEIPDPALIDSMSMRYNHGFGLLNAIQQEGIRRTMRQLYEEVSGHGFYHPGYKLPVHKGDS